MSIETLEQVPVQQVLTGLPPIVGERPRVLILGSFPSEASLAAQCYYAHPQNQFWRLLGACLEMPLADMPYEMRKAAVIGRGIAIWDVYVRCRRRGSLDAAIRAGEIGDLGEFLVRMGTVKRLCFNGKTAGRLADLMVKQGYEVCVLPSSSPAYTLSFEKKLEAWRSALSSTITDTLP